MKPKQFFFLMLGLLVLIALVGGGGYYYAYKLLKTQTTDLAQKMAEEKTIDEQISSLDKLNRAYNREIVPNLPLLDAALPRHKQQTEILAQIEHIAISTGVQQPFTAVTMPSPVGLPSDVSQTSKSGAVLALPINFQAKGTYSQLQAFTSQLETLNRYTNVTNLVIKHDQKKDQISYTFSLNAYIKP
jgi:Tfp pilus assembly protein PilO